MAGKLISISVTPADVERRPADRYARVSVQRAMLVQGRGIQGDAKGNGGIRQINVMRAETLAELLAEGFATAPGEMGEQLVVSGLNGQSFSEGVRLRIGAHAVLEIGIERNGCERFEKIQGRTKESVVGRLGVLARVMEGGEIAVGDEVKFRLLL